MFILWSKIRNCRSKRVSKTNPIPSEFWLPSGSFLLEWGWEPAFCGFGGFPYGRHERSELVRIARKLSKLEPKVLLRNFPSVEEIQEESHPLCIKQDGLLFYPVLFWDECILMSLLTCMKTSKLSCWTCFHCCPE